MVVNSILIHTLKKVMTKEEKKNFQKLDWIVAKPLVML